MLPQVTIHDMLEVGKLNLRLPLPCETKGQNRAANQEETINCQDSVQKQHSKHAMSQLKQNKKLLKIPLRNSLR